MKIFGGIYGPESCFSLFFASCLKFLQFQVSFFILHFSGSNLTRWRHIILQ